VALCCLVARPIIECFGTILAATSVTDCIPKLAAATRMTMCVAPCGDSSCMPWKPLLQRPARPAAPMQPSELCQTLLTSIDYLTPASSPSSPSNSPKMSSRDDARWTEATENLQMGLRAVLKCLEGANLDEVSSSTQEANVAQDGGRAKDGARARGDMRELLTLLLTGSLLARLLQACLCVLDFEAQKDVVRIFSAVLRLSAALGMETQVIGYVQKHSDLPRSVVHGCGRPEVALHCGIMLRACAQYAQLVQILLANGVAEELVSLALHNDFEISSDAFSSLRELLLTHKAEASAHLERNFKPFFELYHMLLSADDYVTQRQALRLLGELLLDRSFMHSMLAYVDNDKFLQIHMILLRDSSKAIQIESFHIFKLFVVNPRKPVRVRQILYKNRDRLVKLLRTFFAKKVEDAPFANDLQIVIETLEKLEPLTAKE